LRNLIALGQVRIEVVFPRKKIARRNRAIQSQPRAHRHFHCCLIQHRQRARESQTEGTGLAIGREAEYRPAAAKQLGLRPQLRMHFHSNDNFVDHRLPAVVSTQPVTLAVHRLTACIKRFA